MTAMLNRTAMVGVIICFFALPLTPASAQPMVNFQGILIDADSDTVVANGLYDLGFLIYDQEIGGVAVWSESHVDVPVVDGIYSVNLGGTNPLDVLNFNANTYWLAMEVNGEPLPTRQQITYSMASLWTANLPADADLDIGDWYLHGTSWPMVQMENTATSSYADNLYLGAYELGTDPDTWILYAYLENGIGGYFDKLTDDGAFAVAAWGATSGTTSEAIYAYGRGDATGGWFDVTLTASGEVKRLSANYNSSEKQLIYLTGSTSLTQGHAQISFESSVKELIADNEPLRVYLTPKSGWSGLWVESSSKEGFDVSCGAGDQNVTFDWLAIAPLKQIEIPREQMRTPSENAKMQQLAARRQQR